MEIETYLRFLAILVLVLAMIAACAWAARRFGLGGALAATKGGSTRLAIVEVKVIDPRRKLILLRRDQKEHLVLLGPNQDLLIENDIAPLAAEAGAPKAPRGGTGPEPTAT